MGARRKKFDEMPMETVSTYFQRARWSKQGKQSDIDSDDEYSGYIRASHDYGKTFTPT